MTFTLRPFQAPEDYAHAIHLVNLLGGEPLTADDWAADEATLSAEVFLERQLAIAPSGEVSGKAECLRFPWLKPGQFLVLSVVEPAFRGQGLGARLLAIAEETARAAGAIELAGSVRDDDPGSVAWVERRGYRQHRHTFESSLDLSAFDPAPFAGVIPAVEVGGIRFIALAERMDAATCRALHAFDCETSRDIPGYESGAPSYEDWAAWYLKHKDALPEGIILATDGDRIAGVTVARREGAQGAWYTHYTAVGREYRGRKLALALKLKSIAVAQAAGAPHMRTNNDSENQPMLAVNRKLGYRPEPGYLRYRKQVESR